MLNIVVSFFYVYQREIIDTSDTRTLFGIDTISFIIKFADLHHGTRIEDKLLCDVKCRKLLPVLQEMISVYIL